MWNPQLSSNPGPRGTNRERCSLDLCNKLELDGKTLLKQSLHVFQISVCQNLLAATLENKVEFSSSVLFFFSPHTLLPSVRMPLPDIKIEAASCRACLTRRFTIGDEKSWRGCVLSSEFCSADQCTGARTEPAVLILSEGGGWCSSSEVLLADWLRAADEIQLFKHSRHRWGRSERGPEWNDLN